MYTQNLLEEVVTEVLTKGASLAFYFVNVPHCYGQQWN
jgi:hypothetical protein